MNTGKKYKILVVEDETIVRENCMRNLSKYGYECLGAEGGIQAIKCVSEKKPDLILMDITMRGDMDGIELCEYFKKSEETCRIPIIFATAHGDDKTLARVIASQGDSLILKPFDPKQMLCSIKIVLSKQQLNCKNSQNKNQFDYFSNPVQTTSFYQQKKTTKVY